MQSEMDLAETGDLLMVYVKNNERRIIIFLVVFSEFTLSTIWKSFYTLKYGQMHAPYCATEQSKPNRHAKGWA